MMMTPTLKSSQNGFTKGHLHSIWIKVLFSYLQLYITSIYCSLILAGFILAGIQGWLKIGFSWLYFSLRLMKDILIFQFVPQLIVTVMCVRESEAGEKWEIFFIILHALRKPCCFLFCLRVSHKLASSLWFHCKKAS